MKVGVIMGSVSDYEVMAEAVAMLEAFGVDFEKRVVSAHRTPDLLCEYAKTARERGIGVIIAGAGGAARRARALIGPAQAALEKPYLSSVAWPSSEST